jgi:hypothetical protein
MSDRSDTVSRSGPCPLDQTRPDPKPSLHLPSPPAVDAFSYPPSETGFPLTAADQAGYNSWLADAAHGLGLGVGLKNDMDQARPLLGV